jgi:hypothetical protein
VPAAINRDRDDYVITPLAGLTPFNIFRAAAIGIHFSVG